ncbi:Hsp70 family protein [Tenacibaculum amylolyticum]|uniref:Hsp70 family protein n=1 Tax=Tenacibaculum amylolyticum TaxID=104269 RepID=UPI003895704E
MKNICGLDFGTSNTISTVYKDGKTQMVSFEEKKSLPSCVFFPFKDIQNPIYGSIATDTYINNGYGRYMKSFKRILGTPFFKQGTSLKPGTTILFHNIIVNYLKHVKKETELFTGKETDYVVVGKPVRLSENENGANSGITQLETILKDVGYKNYSFLEEPIAAAYHHKDKLKEKSLAIVADLGGGTCDFTIVEVEGKNKELQILATSGVSLGGTDIDGSFALKSFFSELGYKTPDKLKGLSLPDTPYRYAADWNKITTSLYTLKTELLVKKMMGNAKYKEKVTQFYELIQYKKAHSLLGEIENTKIKLSDVEKFNFISEFIPNDLTITKNLLEEAIKDIVEKILRTSLQCCELAGVQKTNIDYLILTGGTSKMPFIKEMFTDTFANATLIENNAMDSVALGLLEKAKKDIGL